MSENGMTVGQITEVETPKSLIDALACAKEAMLTGGLSPEKLMSIIQASAKRRQKGRKVPELPAFTFPDSGYTVRVRKLGPWTLDQIRTGLRRVKAPPQVPILDVEDGEDAAGNIRYRKEPNPADPSYKAAVREYDQWLAMTSGYRLLDIIISSCVVVDPEDIDPDDIAARRIGLIVAGPHPNEDKEAAEENRKMVEALSDEEVFIRCVCLSTTEDVGALQAYVTQGSMPTVAEVDEQIEMFQSEVQG